VKFVDRSVIRNRGKKSKIDKKEHHDPPPLKELNKAEESKSLHPAPLLIKGNKIA